MKLSSSPRHCHKLHLAPFHLLSSVRTERGHFPCLPLQCWRQIKSWLLVLCGALTKPHQWKGLCMSVLRGGWKRIRGSCWNLPLKKKNVGGAPRSGAGEKEIFRKRLSANCGCFLRAMGKPVANGASQMSSILLDATLPKCSEALGQVVTHFTKKKHTIFC